MGKSPLWEKRRDTVLDPRKKVPGWGLSLRRTGFVALLSIGSWSLNGHAFAIVAVDSIYKSARVRLAENVTIIEAAIDCGCGSVVRNINERYVASAVSGQYPIAPISSLINGVRRNVVGVTEIDRKFEQLGGCFSIIVDAEIKFSRWPHIDNAPGYTATHCAGSIFDSLMCFQERSASTRNVSTLYFVSMCNLVATDSFGSLCRVFHFGSAFGQIYSLYNESYQLQQSDKSDSDGGPEHPPISRIILAIIFVLCGAITSVWFGPKYSNGDIWNFIGSSLIGGGLLLTAFGFVLAISLGFRDTWGWLL